MNELVTERSMTVREISEVLNLNERTIQLKVKEIYPYLVKNGYETKLNELQVTRIKNSLEKKFEVVTQRDKIETIQKAQTYLMEMVQLLQADNTAKQDRIEKLIHNPKTYTITELAKELNLKSGAELNRMLEDKGIQYKVNKTWVLFAKYSDCGYESIKSEELDNGQIIYNRHWTGKGRDFILDIFNDR